jgi:hypothetical protein
MQMFRPSGVQRMALTILAQIDFPSLPFVGTVPLQCSDTGWPFSPQRMQQTGRVDRLLPDGKDEVEVPRKREKLDLQLRPLLDPLRKLSSLVLVGLLIWASISFIFFSALYSDLHISYWAT